MATVSATWAFADGDTCDVSVEVENDYPDCLAQAATTCMSMLRDAIVFGIVAQGEDEDGE